MTGKALRKSRKRKKFRASRSFRFLLLSLGLTGLILGCGLLAYGHLRKNGRLQSFALMYCGFAAAALGLRQAMVFLHNMGKKKTIQAQRRSRSLRPAVKRPELSEPE